MKSHRKTSPIVRVLSLLIPIFLIYLVLLLRDIAGFRIGSDTDFGAVYKLRYQGKTIGYQWLIFNQDGTVRESDITTAEPYIYQDGQRISLVLQEHDITDAESNFFCRSVKYQNYYLDDTEITTQAFDLPVISKKLKVKSYKPEKLESGSEYVNFYQLKAPDRIESLYIFKVRNIEGEELWYDFSTTQPELVPQEDNSFMIFYHKQDEIGEFMILCNPYADDISHEFHVENNRTIFIEQAFSSFSFPQLKHDFAIAKREYYRNFVNQQSDTEIDSIETAYSRAKQEVTIPYSKVTFRADFILNQEDVSFHYWEVTFSQLDNPEGTAQTVYLTGQGKTVLILDGKPYL